MNYVLDTNAYSDMGRKGMWIDIISHAETVYLPAIVIGELKEGFLGGSQQSHNEMILEQFISEPMVKACDLTITTAAYYAQLKTHLKRSGNPIPTNDIWIAACVLEHQATLLTRDRHFKYLPQVNVMFES